MIKISKEQLLKIPDVVDEINRHLWIESEKAGYDRGFDWAVEDWMKRFAKDWLAYHHPTLPRLGSKSPGTNSKVKKRSAKSYLK